jgi:hypothetical protein
MAVGTWFDHGPQPGVIKDARSVAYSFDGSGWALLQLPPELAGTLLLRVSCDGRTALDCTATGIAYSGAIAQAVVMGPAVVHYLGGSWEPAALPVGGAGRALSGLWCGRGSCIAVGADRASGRPFVIAGAGNHWSGVPAPPARVYALAPISCAGTTSACAAVAQRYASATSQVRTGSVYDWDGSWHAQPASFPRSTDYIGGMSCVPQRDAPPQCTLVGSHQGANGTDQPFVLSGPIGS